MERRRFIQSASLDQRLLEQAERLRKEARGTPPGVERARLLQLARQAEIGAHMSEWLSVPDQRAPR
jgi:hypothetical protein